MPARRDYAPRGARDCTQLSIIIWPLGKLASLCGETIADQQPHTYASTSLCRISVRVTTPQGTRFSLHTYTLHRSMKAMLELVHLSLAQSCSVRHPHNPTDPNHPAQLERS